MSHLEWGSTMLLTLNYYMLLTLSWLKCIVFYCLKVKALNAFFSLISMEMQYYCCAFHSWLYSISFEIIIHNENKSKSQVFLKMIFFNLFQQKCMEFFSKNIFFKSIMTINQSIAPIRYKYTSPIMAQMVFNR